MVMTLLDTLMYNHRAIIIIKKRFITPHKDGMPSSNSKLPAPKFSWFREYSLIFGLIVLNTFIYIFKPARETDSQPSPDQVSFPFSLWRKINLNQPQLGETYERNMLISLAMITDPG